MKLKNGVAFPEAVRIVAELSGIVTPSRRSANPTPRPATAPPASKPAKAASPPPERPSVLTLADGALALLTEAATRLWTPEGTETLAYLHGRGLRDETIRAARLGWTPGVMIPTREGDRCYYPGNKEGHIPTRSASEGPMKSSESRRGSPLDD
ncbi:MAG: hypothetical protein WA746_03180 [Isosphaeraceae bacterium]